MFGSLCFKQNPRTKPMRICSQWLLQLSWLTRWRFCVWLANGLANPNGLPPHRQRRWAPLAKKVKIHLGVSVSYCILSCFWLTKHIHILFVSLFLSSHFFKPPSMVLKSFEFLWGSGVVAKNDLSNFLETALPEWQKGDVETWIFINILGFDFSRCWSWFWQVLIQTWNFEVVFFPKSWLVKIDFLNQHLSGKRIFFIVKPFTVFFCSAIVSRCLSRILYVFFDASDGHHILGHFARQVGRSGEIRGPGMTWMTYGCRRVDLTVSICFDMIFNYIKVGMPTVFLWSEVEYENVSFRFSQVASTLKMFFSQRFVSCEEKIFDICLLNQSQKIG